MTVLPVRVDRFELAVVAASGDAQFLAFRIDKVGQRIIYRRYENGRVFRSFTSGFHGTGDSRSGLTRPSATRLAQVDNKSIGASTFVFS